MSSPRVLSSSPETRKALPTIADRRSVIRVHSIRPPASLPHDRRARHSVDMSISTPSCTQTAHFNALHVRRGQASKSCTGFQMFHKAARRQRARLWNSTYHFWKQDSSCCRNGGVAESISQRPHPQPSRVQRIPDRQNRVTCWSKFQFTVSCLVGCQPFWQTAHRQSVEAIPEVCFTHISWGRLQPQVTTSHSTRMFTTTHHRTMRNHHTSPEDELGQG